MFLVIFVFCITENLEQRWSCSNGDRDLQSYQCNKDKLQRINLSNRTMYVAAISKEKKSLSLQNNKHVFDELFCK